MAVWEQATESAGAITLDGSGDDWVRVLSPSFRIDGGESDDFTYVGFGNKLVKAES